MAFEAVTLLSSTLAQLEVGKLAICKFGETAQLLHGFQDAFSDEIGAHVLSHLAFEQKGTSIVKVQLLLASCAISTKHNVIMLQLMELTCSSFQQQSTSSVTELPARLLLIISDGRGVFAEGTDRVMSAVKLALAQNVFLVFIILDNPHSQVELIRSFCCFLIVNDGWFPVGLNPGHQSTSVWREQHNLGHQILHGVVPVSVLHDPQTDWLVASGCWRGVTAVV